MKQIDTRCRILRPTGVEEGNWTAWSVAGEDNLMNQGSPKIVESDSVCEKVRSEFKLRK